jgi:preprotein translocase subunit Sec63
VDRANPSGFVFSKKEAFMDNTFTIIFGIVAMLLPIVVGRLVWKRFDQYFGRGDEAYMDTLEYFLKKIGSTILVAFILLWIGMSLVFSGSAS